MLKFKTEIYKSTSTEIKFMIINIIPSKNLNADSYI